MTLGKSLSQHFWSVVTFTFISCYVIKQGIMWLQYKCHMCAQTFSVSQAPKETDDLVPALKKLTELLWNIEPVYEKDMKKIHAK